MAINKNTARTLTEIFISYQDDDYLAFNKTEIIVKLARFEEEILISRSQAKRIALNLEKFDRVVLDFSGIRLVGQGFADQLFRVYATQHPNTKLKYINANEDVSFMIRRGINTHKSRDSP